jgi:hypothetical protein
MPDKKPNYMGVALVGVVAVGAYLAYRYFSNQNSQSTDTGMSGGGGGISGSSGSMPGAVANPTDTSVPTNFPNSSSGESYIFMEDPKGNLVVPNNPTPGEANAFMTAVSDFVRQNATVRPYIGTNAVGQNLVVNLNRTSATDPLRFARNPETGAVIDRYAQQSVQPATAIKRIADAKDVYQPGKAAYSDSGISIAPDFVTNLNRVQEITPRQSAQGIETTPYRVDDTGSMIPRTTPVFSKQWEQLKAGFLRPFQKTSASRATSNKPIGTQRETSSVGHIMNSTSGNNRRAVSSVRTPTSQNYFTTSVAAQGQSRGY